MADNTKRLFRKFQKIQPVLFQALREAPRYGSINLEIIFHNDDIALIKKTTVESVKIPDWNEGAVK
jgi:hypothetical protein